MPEHAQIWQKRKEKWGGVTTQCSQVECEKMESFPFNVCVQTARITEKTRYPSPPPIFSRTSKKEKRYLIFSEEKKIYALVCTQPLQATFSHIHLRKKRGEGRKGAIVPFFRLRFSLLYAKAMQCRHPARFKASDNRKVPRKSVRESRKKLFLSIEFFSRFPIEGFKL